MKTEKQYKKQCPSPFLEVRARVEDTSRSIHFEGAFELDTGASWETAFPFYGDKARDTNFYNGEFDPGSG